MSSVVSGVAVGEAPHRTGVLPSQAIRGLIQNHRIEAVEDILAEQIQPASLDLRLGGVAYRVRASFMPGADSRMMDKIEQFGMHEIDLANGAVLERGCVYIVPLLESIRLSGDLAAFANPKSSTGRLDVFTRLITDNAITFDRVERNYHGPLFIEIAPRTFSIVVRKGSRLNQIRLRRGSPVFGKETLQRLHEEVPLTDAGPGKETIREKRVGLTIDLEGDPETGLVGYRAKKNADVIDVDARAAYDPAGYWEPLHSRPGEGIILDPHDFYILATKEAVTVPPTHAAEMVAYDTGVGEFRVHYAGFFDPGFGYGRPEDASKAVLEVRSHEVPFVLEHEQIIGWLRYERLIEAPERIYGQGIGSTYQGQGLMLAKQFRPPV
ncbi:MAG: 2'-deoxycytidine 5'-triphosphate deaminase [Alphaproteobacteria bacterium]